MGIAVLGPLLIDDGSAVLGRRDRVVLTALAVRPGEPLRLDQLVDALWGDRPPPSAAKVVQGCIVRLRKRLGRAAIESTVPGYRLTVPLDEIDAQRFERALTRARSLLRSPEHEEQAAYLLNEGLALWRGDALADLDGWGAGRIERDRLEELRHEAEELLVEASMHTGRWDEVVARAESMVAEQPLREYRWALLTLAQYRSGRQGDALRTLRRARTLLSRELGIDPGPQLTELEQAVLRQDPDLLITSRPTEPSPDCPYRGLLPYDTDDADRFFGRGEDVSACLRRLGATGVLAVVGPSGAGKSSLVRAGVVASLRRDGKDVRVLTPGSRPVAALEAVGPVRATTTIVVDQCEELYVTCQDRAERTQFLDRVLQHAQTGHVIVVLRADHLADVTSHGGFSRLIERGMLLIAAMREDQLREAIEEPARSAGLDIEPALVEVLVREVSLSPGALPMLSHALQETWQRREGHTLTMTGYEACGGIQEAVARSAEAVYTEVDASSRPVLRDLLLRLVTPAIDAEPVPVRVPRRLLVTDERSAALVDRLVADRLLTSDTEVVEIAHEALVRAWPRLRDWLDQDVEGQLIRRHLTDAADAWDRLDRPASELYRGVRLAQALDWRHRTGASLTPLEQGFLEVSDRLAANELRDAQERALLQARVSRRLRMQLVIACVLVVATVVAGLTALQQARRADVQRVSADVSRAEADSSALGADARRLGARALITEDIRLSLLLAVAGARLDDNSETRADLLAVLAKRAQLMRVRSLAGTGPLGPVATSPGRGTYAVSDGTGQVVLLDHVTNEIARAQVERRTASHHDVLSVFNADGSRLAIGSMTPSSTPVSVLDSYTLEPAGPRLVGLPFRRAQVTDLEFSNDGQRLAATLGSPSSAGDGGRGVLLVWSLRRPSRPLRIELPPGPQGLALSRDGETVYTSWPLTARDVDTGRVLWRSSLRGRDHLSLNPAGDRLAMPEWDGADNASAVVVDAGSGHLLHRLVGHRGSTIDARFSPNGRTLATSSDDGTVLLWDPTSGLMQDRLDTGQVNTFAFSALGSRLVTTNDAHQLLLWDLAGHERYLPRSGTGQRVPEDSGVMRASADGNTVAYLWQPRDQGPFKIAFYDDPARRLGPTSGAGFRSSVDAAAWAPGHRLLAVSGDSGVVRMWNLATGRVGVTRRIAPDPVTSLTFTADGAWLVVGTKGGLVRKLDPGTLGAVGPAVELGGAVCCLAAQGPRHVSVFSALRADDGPGGASRRWTVLDLNAGTRVSSQILALGVTAAAATPVGDRVAATGSNGDLWLLAPVSGRVLRRISSETSQPPVNVGFSAGGLQILTTTRTGTVTVWDGRTGASIATMQTPANFPAVATFISSSRDVLLAASDGTVYHWNPEPLYAETYACGLAGRSLTVTEWHTYVGARKPDLTCPQPISAFNGQPPEYFTQSQ